LEFRFFGEGSPSAILKNAFLRRGIADRLTMGGVINSEQALLEQLKSDILLLIQLKANIQVPAKIFENAFIGKPIICFAERESETANIVMQYKLGSIMHPSQNPIQMVHFLTDLNHIPYAPEIDRFKIDFDGVKQSSRLVSLISGENDPTPETTADTNPFPI